MEELETPTSSVKSFNFSNILTNHQQQPAVHSAGAKAEPQVIGGKA